MTIAKILIGDAVTITEFYSDGEFQMLTAADYQAAEQHLKNRGYQVVDRTGDITTLEKPDQYDLLERQMDARKQGDSGLFFPLN